MGGGCEPVHGTAREVAAMDGLVIQHEVSHDAARCLRDLDNIIRAATLLVGLEPRSVRRTGDGAATPSRRTPTAAAGRS